MPSRVRTTPEEVLDRVRQRLVDTVFADENVFVSLNVDQGQPPPAERYCVIVPEGARPWDGPVTGGGNTCLWLQDQLQLILWVRLYLDQSGRDGQLLTNRALGALSLFGRTIGALQQHDVENADGDWILAEPMRLAPVGFKPRPRKPQPGWGSIAATWDVQYIMDVVPPVGEE